MRVPASLYVKSLARPMSGVQRSGRTPEYLLRPVHEQNIRVSFVRQKIRYVYDIRVDHSESIAHVANNGIVGMFRSWPGGNNKG
jgi:hypothetical protein